MDKQRPRYQQVILAIAIAVVLVSFVLYFITVVYPAPKYEDFCPQTLYQRQPMNKSDCENVGGQWSENPQPQAPVAVPACKGDNCTQFPSGWCDVTFTCNGKYQNSTSVYDRNLFLSGSFVGVAILALGFVIALTPVSAGVSIGGVILILISIIRYWSEFDKYIRLLLLGVLLVVLIWLGYRKFGGRKR